jgi:hypothetical protein
LLKISPKAMARHRRDAVGGNLTDSSGAYSFRKPQRLTITVPWNLYDILVQRSDQQGRSLSNLACYWLERQADQLRRDPFAQDGF